MDQLRARAYLDLLLGKDSRPRGSESAAKPAGGAAPAGFAGRVTLTVPLITLAGLADRPGELGSLGPVDPWLARDLAACRRVQPEDHLVRDGHRRPRGTPSATAAPAPNPRATGNAPGRARQERPGSPSPRPAGTGRPAGTAPGGCAPRAAGRT